MGADVECLTLPSTTAPLHSGLQQEHFSGGVFRFPGSIWKNGKPGKTGKLPKVETNDTDDTNDTNDVLTDTSVVNVIRQSIELPPLQSLIPKDYAW